MQLTDWHNFKTKKCENHQGSPLSPYYLSCSFYHNKDDKRRTPLNAIDGKNMLVYSEEYLEDYFSIYMSSNLIEYLYHPNLYKTIQCNQRFASSLAKFLPLQQFNHMKQECRYCYCPFIHQDDDLSRYEPFRNLQIFSKQPESTAFKSFLAQDISTLMTYDIKSGVRPFADEIDKYKQLFLNRLKMDEQAKITEALKLKPTPEPPIIEVKKEEKNEVDLSGMVHGEYEYVAYNYFQHGEKLPIIEDRHHEFKNFRDIINNSIVPIVMKYINAFLNSEGGVLYIGIDDSSVVTGFKLTQHEFDKFLLAVDKQGKFNMHPPLMPQKYSIRRIPVYSKKGYKDLWVLEIKVTPQQDKRNKILSTYNRDCYVRMTASTHKLDALGLLEYIRLIQQEKKEQLDEIQLGDDLKNLVDRRGKNWSLGKLQLMKKQLSKIMEKLQVLIGAKGV